MDRLKEYLRKSGVALEDQMPYTGSMGKANLTQVGGTHYKKGGEEHWDRAWRLKYDPFQYIITKWIERWRDKGGIQDLEKAKHAIEKYIEVVRAEQEACDGSEPGPGYTDQDRRSEGVARGSLPPRTCVNCHQTFVSEDAYFLHECSPPR